MSLFKKEEREPQDIVETPVEETQDIVEEPYMLETEEPEQRVRMDEESARIQFSILIRDLYDIEKQLKEGPKKYTDVDEMKRDKQPSELEMMNRAERIKLNLAPLMDAFLAIGYSKDQLENMKREALEGIKHYAFYTQ